MIVLFQKMVYIILCNKQEQQLLRRLKNACYRKIL
uniref:Uncharacterized protein n=1 Tax=Myoviridae sp. ct8ME27 TaxID=2826622 RepID=A0A8S5N6X1_9CAUD|nr:MAG TPA: hypothetical protein [Myoviridae sp. ct8ME27]